ncbi:hypothetical protein FUA48_07870 [Flavobacterium alkalisoli]|uniref:Uncharacterized protein n=1 Tax=Flavobacterium alkalisoli TaxID=2602769 RepID=A0A5B9FTG9_9FLAO|nr:hypothetical protein [Flavobacterium alkalisoli]QEE49501.1 hypothetical protein FUA48_07870 [Flavobacterium alkalisoli]
MQTKEKEEEKINEKPVAKVAGFFVYFWKKTSMKKTLLLLCIVSFFSCNNKSVIFNSLSSSEDDEKINCDTILNNNHVFKICMGINANIFILKDNDTIYKHPEWVNSYEVKDFNEDGYKDIIFYYMSNYPLEKIYLFDKSHNLFRLVKNSDSHPESVKIKGSDLYYSYNRRGCADLNWDSDLYYIKEFEIHKIGNITGIGCERDDDEIKNGIYIYKTKKDSIQTLIQYIPRDSGYYGDKWEFIEKYWNENYKNFKS